MALSGDRMVELVAGLSNSVSEVSALARATDYSDPHGPWQARWA